MTAPVAMVSLCSAGRVDHLRGQLAAVGESADAQRIVVWIGDDAPPPLEAEVVVRVPPGAHGLRLAAARNAGAAAAVAAGAEVLVFLDADCVPAPALIRRYRQAAERFPGAVLCGPVTYLPEGVSASAPAELSPAPHPARPVPADDEEREATAAEYPLFWSLSFALTPSTWAAAGGFDEAYEGYGGEDTDFAFRLRAARIPLVWTGGAHAFHQHHPTSSPPWQHLDDILRNGAVFADRWHEWPMTGWLESFAAAGAIVRDGDGWRRSE